MDEIEALYVSLGVTPDEASAVEAVNKMTDKIKQSLKSSIYGGKKGVITLPATIEGTYKNGKEIEKEIVDAYTAIYNKAKEMADSSVSLTLKDIEDFKKQINKFGKMTAKKRGNDIIANANNNLQQTVTAYQDLVTDLKKQVSVQQKQIAKSKPTPKKQKSTNYISDEEIANDIKREQKRRISGIKTAGPKGYPSTAIDPGKTNDYAFRMSEGSPYKSTWALQQARAKKEEDKKTAASLVTYINKEMAQNAPTGKKTTSQEQDRFMNSNILRQFGASLTDLSKGKEGTTPETVYQNLVAVLKQFSSTNQSLETTFNAIKNMTEYSKSDNPRRRLGSTDGTPKGVGPNDEEAKLVQKTIYKSLDNIWNSPELRKSLGFINIFNRNIEEAGKEVKKTTNEIKKRNKTKTNNSQVGKRSEELKSTSDTAKLVNDLTKIQEGISENATETKKSTKATETQTNYDKIENASERVADTAQETEQKATTDANKEEAKEISADAQTGFNTDNNAKELLNDQSDLKRIMGKEIKDTLTGILSALSMLKSLNGLGTATKLQTDSSMQPCCDALTKLVEIAQHIDVTTGNVLQGLISMGAKLPTNLPALIKGETVKDRPVDKEPFIDKTDHNKLYSKQLQDRIEKERNSMFVKNSVEKYKTERKDKQDMYDRLFGKGGVNDANSAKNIKDLGKKGANTLQRTKAIMSSFQPNNKSDVRKNAREISTMSAEQQAALRARRINTFGLSDRGRATATGDVSQTYRVKRNYGWGKNIENPFKDLNLTDGMQIDTTAVTEALQNAIQKNMFDAQTGGGWKNLIGAMTGYVGMPSLEKSRAQADAANQMMANIRAVVQDILNDIQSKETDLKGLENKGLVSFENGKLVEDKSKNGAGTKLFADLEDQKLALQGVLADVNIVNQTVKDTGGDLTKIFQQLGFASQELRDNNNIIQNINAGLDKNGKALKFQTRTGETLNYTFQLMSRSIGQMFKNWISMLNPLNLIKKAFTDFMGYDVKWQRTMNVIKYNLRAIIRPAMQWIAQQIVNMIGLVNALIKGIGKAFGKKWDLFDKSAANTEKMREDLEAAANVTAGFDELHDIGSDNSAANDLTGDIYTPQWEGLNKILEKVGETLGNIGKIASKLNFWQWLAIAGAALIGFKILKWLMNIFGKGKNPLEGVANGLAFLEKAVGWALLIWAFTEFTKALTAFVDCMKTASWEDIAKSLIMLAGAFATLVGGIAGVAGIAKLLDTTTGELFGLSALVGVFGLFVKAIIPFIQLMADIKKEFPDEADQFEVLAGSLSMLALSFVDLIGGIAGAEWLTKLVGLDWKNLMGLSAVVGALDLFVAAIVPFIEAVGSIDGNKWDTIIPMIVGLGGAFISLAAGVGAVSKTFTAMDWKAIGQLYVVAGVFEVFVGVLVLFVNAIKDVSFETLAGGTTLIAGAFLSLAGAVALVAPALKMLDWSNVLQLVVILTAFSAVLWVLQEFVHSLQDLSSEQLLSGLALLAGGLAAITLAISALAIVFTGVATTGIGAVALALLALVLGAVSLVILSIADLVRALGESGEGIKKICEGIAEVVQAVGDVIIGIVDIVIGKVAELAIAIAHEIGETIRTIIETVGKVITDIINSMINAIPNLLKSIVNFCHDIGPAIENSVDAIIRSITKLVNFVVSAVEYICNLVIGAVNKLSFDVPDWVPGIGGSKFGFNIQKMEIPRFVPKYETGTNYVPNDGLAYLHQGEAVVPKKYNQPYQQQGLSQEEREYMNQMMKTMSALNTTMSQGIPVKGEFKQRGNDLVAVVEKANNRNSNNILSNKVYAR